MIRFRCDNCGETYEVEEKHAGKRTKCARCQSPVRVPGSGVAESTRPQRPLPRGEGPPAHDHGPVVEAAQSPRVQVTVDQDKATGVQGFFRAFGITSGFMAAVAAVAVGVPVLACGGCLAWMAGVGAMVEVPDQTENSPSEKKTAAPPAAEMATAPTESPSETTEVEEDLPPAKVTVIETFPKVDLSDREGYYVFSDDLVATIEDEYISDVRLVDYPAHPVTADVLLDNRSGEEWKPDVHLEFINAYGVVLGQCSIDWALTSLKPNQRHTESVKYYPVHFGELFQYSPLTRPHLYDRPKYLGVTYHYIR